eukprot:SM000268S09751  [mRNA]  locus=s268:81452:83697:- [translate_table: standard]
MAPQPPSIKPIYCGNFEYDARPSEIERLFRKYGRVEKVDMKTGFAFVYMEDDRDAEDAIRALDRSEFGRQRRRLCVEWAKQSDSAIKRREEERRRMTKAQPSKTLFVVNFDPINTRVRDLERIFERFGKLVRAQIRKNFAFVQYENQDEATRALEETNNMELEGRVVTVEYAAREVGTAAAGYDREAGDSSPPRGRDRDRSPVYSRYRSASPPRRQRSRSPDYKPYDRHR